jgi:nucleoside-diphosphate-sugar epimerase
MYDASDADPRTRSVSVDAIPTTRTHYGVYKHANEGNAGVYWLEHGLSSICLRPMTIYGPGRDQGMTSAGTIAMLAAAVGRDYHSPFSGSTLLNYAEDTAQAFIAASRSSLQGAHLINLPGVTADMKTVIAAIDRVVPGAGARITFEQKDLPFPDRADTNIDTLIPGLPVTDFDAGVAATIELFRTRLSEGRLVPAEHGLK